MGGAALNWNREPSGTRKREREKGRGGSGEADRWPTYGISRFAFLLRLSLAARTGTSVYHWPLS